MQSNHWNTSKIFSKSAHLAVFKLRQLPYYLLAYALQAAARACFTHKWQNSIVTRLQLTIYLAVPNHKPWGYMLTIQERAYARFHIVSFLGEEVFAHDVYTKDELRIFCECAMFFAKTARTQACECCDHMFGYILSF